MLTLNMEPRSLSISNETSCMAPLWAPPPPPRKPPRPLDMEEMYVCVYVGVEEVKRSLAESLCQIFWSIHDSPAATNVQLLQVNAVSRASGHYSVKSSPSQLNYIAYLVQSSINVIKCNCKGNNCIRMS